MILGANPIGAQMNTKRVITPAHEPLRTNRTSTNIVEGGIPMKFTSAYVRIISWIVTVIFYVIFIGGIYMMHVDEGLGGLALLAAFIFYYYPAILIFTLFDSFFFPTWKMKLIRIFVNFIPLMFISIDVLYDSGLKSLSSPWIWVPLFAFVLIVFANYSLIFFQTRRKSTEGDSQ